MIKNTLYAATTGLLLFIQTSQSFAKPPADPDIPQWSKPKISASGKSLSLELKLPANGQTEEGETRRLCRLEIVCGKKPSLAFGRRATEFGTSKSGFRPFWLVLTTTVNKKGQEQTKGHIVHLQKDHSLPEKLPVGDISAVPYRISEFCTPEGKAQIPTHDQGIKVNTFLYLLLRPKICAIAPDLPQCQQ